MSVYPWCIESCKLLEKKRDYSSGVGDAEGSLAALHQLGQRVAQLRQLEDLAVQQLQQGAKALPVGFPLQLAALQAQLQVVQLRLQRLVPRLRLLEQREREVEEAFDKRGQNNLSLGGNPPFNTEAIFVSSSVVHMNPYKALTAIPNLMDVNNFVPLLFFDFFLVCFVLSYG